jgi:hypothetical protein
MAQDGEIVLQDSEKNLARQIIAIFGPQTKPSDLASVVDNVDHESHETIHEVFPGPRLTLQTAVQQATVDFSQYHNIAPLAFDGCRRGESMPQTSQQMPYQQGGSTDPRPTPILNPTLGLGK